VGKKEKGKKGHWETLWEQTPVFAAKARISIKSRESAMELVKLKESRGGKEAIGLGLRGAERGSCAGGFEG